MPWATAGAAGGGNGGNGTGSGGATGALHVVLVFGSDSWRPPPSAAAAARPFDRAAARFLAPTAAAAERAAALKMVPRVERGGWALRRAVGQTPVIVGRKLATTFHVTNRYVEVDVDVASCAAAAYIVSMARCWGRCPFGEGGGVVEPFKGGKEAVAVRALFYGSAPHHLAFTPKQKRKRRSRASPRASPSTSPSC